MVLEKFRIEFISNLLKYSILHYKWYIQTTLEPMLSSHRSSATQSHRADCISVELE